MSTADNPLLKPWTAPFGLPPFAEIRPEHFMPAFEAAMAAQRARIDAIAADPAEPTFDNTITALEKSGFDLGRVAEVFFNLSGADTNDALQAIEREIAPKLARHESGIVLDPKLFARIADLWERRAALGLNDEQARVLERYRTRFVRAGAALDEAARTRLAAITERLATLGTLFSQNVLADEQSWTMVLEDGPDLDGLPAWLRSAASEAAAARGLPGNYVITLSRSSVEPFLQASRRRDLREKAFRAWIARGENEGPTSNKAIIAEMVALRAERARLLGFASYAEFRLADTMARTPQNARGLLEEVWKPALERVAAEAADLQKLIAERGGNFPIAAWDWRHYAEEMRKQRFSFDEEGLAAYFQLDNIIEAAFYTANRLFGLSFRERPDLRGYHADVRIWEALAADGRHVGLFLGDYFARPSKRSGAWMSAFRDQHRLDGEVTPIIVNVMNFAKAGAGQPTLLSLDDARTLFHEFGHAMHGMLSNVTYPFISGTNVARDFVELPSQLYEHWLEQPEILGRFARHHRTGEPLPEEMMKRLKASRLFNQGFVTVEYTSSALVDLDLHERDAAEELDVADFERSALARIGMPEAIVMRHRTPHFAHIFSGDGYAAGYYSYLWSEVLDADGFAAFEETGDIFNPEVARRLHDYVYSAGSLRDPQEAYLGFRGRMPSTEALLKKRGLDQPKPQ